MHHSPADVLRQLLIAIGQCTEPADLLPWPVYCPSEPDAPDELITVTDTAGRDGGRTMVDGERQEYFGASMRVRSLSRAAGWLKARQVCIALDEHVYQARVAIGMYSYIVQSIARQSVVYMGRELPTTRRFLHTVNVTATIYQE